MDYRPLGRTGVQVSNLCLGTIVAAVALDAAVLDRIDEILKPGVNLNPADTSYGEQVLQPALRRR
jgi:aryl-alcohol dehydrogenase-like predicted oxidoreductase